MSTRSNEARTAIQNARDALHNGDRGLARKWAERAAQLAPRLEDPWLILAVVAGPRQSLEYVQRALELNPNSARARQGMEWAMQRLRDPEANLAHTQPGIPRTSAATPSPRKRSNRALIAAAMLLVLGCAVCAVAGWTATTTPVLASIIPRMPLGPGPTAGPSWAEADIPKPTYTPGAPLAQGISEEATSAVIPLATPTVAQSDLSTAISTGDSTGLSTDLPTAASTELAAEFPTSTPEVEPLPPTAEPTWSGTLSLDIVPDTPTSEIPTAAPAPTSAPPSGVAGGVHWIDVNLSQQMVYAYAGDALVNSFVVSTGVWQTPTVTGKYRVYVKLRYTDMSGPGYYLPDVPYTMFFYKDYALHGTYWHHNFGTPMSHGCVNLSIPDAEWLYNFSSVGTLVNVHY